MNTIRPCGCKGVRTCLQCEREFNLKIPSLKSKLQEELEPWSYCCQCKRFYYGWDAFQIAREHPHHESQPDAMAPLAGVYVQNNFLQADEASNLMEHLDTLPWCISQSGRRKQNYGPKTNFKKRKLQNGEFHGFPACTEFVQSRLKEVSLLHDYQTIEQCTLEYDPAKGAAIDPHIDDCWIWGERVVTVNCLGDAVLTLTLYEPSSQISKYNLDLLAKYEQTLLHPLLSPEEIIPYRSRVLRIPMANLSLIVLYGPARYQFEHAVLREDIRNRRVCLAFREFTPMYLPTGEQCDQGDAITENAKNFSVS